MQALSLVDRARGRWSEILPALGIDSKLLAGRHCPCPVCGGKDRFRFDDKEGRGTWICNQCGAGDGVQLVMALNKIEFRDAAKAIEGVVGANSAPLPAGEDDSARRAAFIRKMISELRASSIKVSDGDPVDRYLRRRVPGLKFIPEKLRTVLSGEHWGKAKVKTFHPLMLARVDDMHGDPIALHRTYLTTDGSKAAVDPDEVKMNLGSLPDGVAVRLAKPGKIMGVAEGIETALSAMAIHRIPVWATMNAGRLEAWSPPEGVTEIVIFGDNDLNCRGQEAAYALGARLNKTIMAQVLLPPDPGADWNDVHNQKERAA